MKDILTSEEYFYNALKSSNIENFRDIQYFIHDLNFDLKFHYSRVLQSAIDDYKVGIFNPSCIIFNKKAPLGTLTLREFVLSLFYLKKFFEDLDLFEKCAYLQTFIEKILSEAVEDLIQAESEIFSAFNLNENLIEITNFSTHKDKMEFLAKLLNLSQDYLSKEYLDLHAEYFFKTDLDDLVLYLYNSLYLIFYDNFNLWYANTSLHSDMEELGFTSFEKQNAYLIKKAFFQIRNLLT